MPKPRYYPDTNWETAQRIADWVRSQREYRFFGVLPILLKPFNSPILEHSPIREMILADREIMSLIKSILDGVLKLETGDIADYWRDLEEEVYRFLDDWEITYRIGHVSVICDLIDLVFGIILNLSPMNSNTMEFYNAFLRGVYETDKEDWQREENLNSLRGHQNDLSQYLIDGYDTHRHIVKELVPNENQEID